MTQFIGFNERGDGQATGLVRPTNPLPPGEAEKHHSHLVVTIMRELRHYGPHALLGIVATLLEGRATDGVADPVECDRIAEQIRRQFDV